MLADCLLKQDDITLIEIKDYIKNPKPSGYRSLHLIVEVPIFLQSEKRNMKVEVQLRTIAMDFWASLEHKLRYKKNIPEKQVQELSYELKECSEISAKLDKRMQEIRNRIALSESVNTSKAEDKIKLPLFNSPFGLLSRLAGENTDLPEAQSPEQTAAGK